MSRVDVIQELRLKVQVSVSEKELVDQGLQATLLIHLRSIVLHTGQ
jgi:hypothetical protein